jgi:hypothetical protein
VTVLRFTPPPLTGECCRCADCLRAGVTDKPVVRAPNGELHGKALAEWYAEREKFDAAMAALVQNRRMP